MGEPPKEGLFLRLHTRYGDRLLWFIVLLVAGVASIVIRLLIAYDFHTTSLLYVAVPYGVSFALAMIQTPEEKTWWMAFLDHALKAMIVFLASSIVLFEGFICVLFFMPIYFLGFTVAFIGTWIVRTARSARARGLAFMVPVVVLATSVEGTTEPLSFSRDERITVSRTVAMSPDAVLANLAQPIKLGEPEALILSVFPMPYRVDSGSLNPGDVHTVHTRYHRWFVTNTHEGEMRLRIREVGPDYVVTEFLEDTSYFSNYLEMHGTRIDLTPLDDGRTTITLQLEYTRLLDPAWYFGPIQRHAVSRMGSMLIDDIMVRADAR
ncbi:MAG: hypothetical protein AAF229_11355 [Pseudomonadota bacterium]